MSLSDSEDELNMDISQWKPRTTNSAPRPADEPLRTFASINATSHSPHPVQEIQDDDEDIDAILEELATSGTEPRAQDAAPRSEVQVVIQVDPDFDRDAYVDCTYGAHIVRRVLQESVEDGDISYTVEFVDRHVEQVSLPFSSLTD